MKDGVAQWSVLAFLMTLATAVGYLGWGYMIAKYRLEVESE